MTDLRPIVWVGTAAILAVSAARCSGSRAGVDEAQDAQNAANVTTIIHAYRADRAALTAAYRSTNATLAPVQRAVVRADRATGEARAALTLARAALADEEATLASTRVALAATANVVDSLLETGERERAAREARERTWLAERTYSVNTLATADSLIAAQAVRISGLTATRPRWYTRIVRAACFGIAASAGATGGAAIGEVKGAAAGAALGVAIGAISCR